MLAIWGEVSEMRRFLLLLWKQMSWTIKVVNCIGQKTG